MLGMIYKGCRSQTDSVMRPTVVQHLALLESQAHIRTGAGLLDEGLVRVHRVVQVAFQSQQSLDRVGDELSVSQAVSQVVLGRGWGLLNDSNGKKRFNSSRGRIASGTRRAACWTWAG